MSVNRYRPHVLVLPEDDANRQLATGFWVEVDHYTRMQVLPEAGGWLSVCELFESQHVTALKKYQEMFLILLLDFDGEIDRREKVMERIPEELKSRVFLLGAQSDPEALRRAGLGTFEAIGRTLAQECRDCVRSVWSHSLLQHNMTELDRLRPDVRKILF